VFWLDSYTIAHVVSNSEKNVQELYAIPVNMEITSGKITDITPGTPALVGTLPTSPNSPASNFVYRTGAQTLVYEYLS
jgi:hypothetical protein